MKRKRNRRIFGFILGIHVPTSKLVSRKQIAIVFKSMSSELATDNCCILQPIPHAPLNIANAPPPPHIS